MDLAGRLPSRGQLPAGKRPPAAAAPSIDAVVVEEAAAAWRRSVSSLAFVASETIAKIRKNNTLVLRKFICKNKLI